MDIFKRNDPNAFENHSLCKKCGGKCCINSPCILHESDMPDKNPSKIIETIQDNNFSINALLEPGYYKNFDYFKFPYYFVSSATHISPRVDLLDMPGECANLTKKGCAFDSKHRPMGGRLLVPSEDMHCRYKDKNVIRDIIFSWMDYQENLNEAVEILTESSVGRTISNLYNALVESPDDLKSNGFYNGKGFRLSYLYCKLVNEYGLKLEPDDMYTLQNVLEKFPDYRMAILDYAKSHQDHINYAEITEIIMR